MTLKDDAPRVQRVCEAALKLDPEERDEYLDRVCAGDPELRAEVASLVARRSGQLSEPAAFETIAASQVSIAGRVIGPYVVRRELGRGGMGVVYLADDTRLARRVALKSLTPGLDHALGGRRRLEREARAAAGLSHPGIATVYALEEIDNQLYLACEYVPGEPLRALLESGPLPIAQVVTIGSQLAKALAAAHTEGIVHRDIKPENVMKTPSGVVKVLDFGLAHIDNDGPWKLTQSGVILGTPAYLSPEQALGKSIDFRTDLFALGLLMYELASGINPFVTTSLTGTIARIIESEPTPLSSLRPEIMPELDRIVAMCLRKDPLDRYQSTQDLVADFDRLEAELNAARQHQSSRRLAAAQRQAPPAGALWWWEFHQIAMSAMYAVMIAPARYVQRWLGEPWGILFLFAVLAPAAWAASLRLHLWFLARQNARGLVAEHARTRSWLRAADLGFAISQFVGAAGIGRGHPEFAMLFVTIATVTLAGTLVIEPATTRAAFGDITA